MGSLLRANVSCASRDGHVLECTEMGRTSLEHKMFCQLVQLKHTSEERYQSREGTVFHERKYVQDDLPKPKEP